MYKVTFVFNENPSLHWNKQWYLFINDLATSYGIALCERFNQISMIVDGRVQLNYPNMETISNLKYDVIHAWIKNNVEIV